MGRRGDHSAANGAARTRKGRNNVEHAFGVAGEQAAQGFARFRTTAGAWEDLGIRDVRADSRALMSIALAADLVAETRRHQRTAGSGELIATARHPAGRWLRVDAEKQPDYWSRYGAERLPKLRGRSNLGIYVAIGQRRGTMDRVAEVRQSADASRSRVCADVLLRSDKRVHRLTRT